MTHYPLIIIAFLFTSCQTTKYIPQEYFSAKHDLDVHLTLATPEVYGDDNDGGLLSNLVAAAAKNSRVEELEEVFSDIKDINIKNQISSEIKKNLKKYYTFDKKNDDLQVKISMVWGWHVPASSYGIRVGSYSIILAGSVEVFDVAKNRKKIGETIIRTTEVIDDRFDRELTRKTLAIVSKEFSNSVGEFLWTAAEDKKP